MPLKPLLIIQPATSYDDLPMLCEKRGDEIAWLSECLGIERSNMIVVKINKGESLPAPKDVHAAIITGAIDMVTDGHLWIEETAQWVREAIATNTPLLGICFGHQLIAYALGGNIGRNPNGAKFGNTDIRSTGSAANDLLFGSLPDSMNMQVFHFQSVLSLPKGAEVLAKSDHDPNHVVRYTKYSWGVQFHPEFDTEIMEYVYDVYEKDISCEGFCVNSLRKSAFDTEEGKVLLQRFFSVSLEI